MAPCEKHDTKALVKDDEQVRHHHDAF